MSRQMLPHVRAAAPAIEDALVPIMTGLVAADRLDAALSRTGTNGPIRRPAAPPFIYSKMRIFACK